MFKFVYKNNSEIISFPKNDDIGYNFTIEAHYLHNALKKAEDRINNLYHIDSHVIDKMLYFCSNQRSDEEPNSSFLLYQEKFSDEELMILENLGIIVEQKRGYVLSYNNDIITVENLFKNIKEVN